MPDGESERPPIISSQGSGSWPYGLELTESGRVAAYVSHPITGGRCQMVPDNTSLHFDNRSDAPCQYLIHSRGSQSFLYDFNSNQIWDFKLGADTTRHQGFLNQVEVELQDYLSQQLGVAPDSIRQDDHNYSLFCQVKQVVSNKIALESAHYLVATQEDLSPVLLSDLLLSIGQHRSEPNSATDRQTKSQAEAYAQAYYRDMTSSCSGVDYMKYLDERVVDYENRMASRQYMRQLRFALDDLASQYIAEEQPVFGEQDKNLITVGTRHVFSQLLVDLASAPSVYQDVVTLEQAKAQQLALDAINARRMSGLDEPIISVCYQESAQIASTFFAHLQQRFQNSPQFATHDFYQQIQSMMLQRHVYDFSEDLFEVLLANSFPYKYNGQYIC